MNYFWSSGDPERQPFTTRKWLLVLAVLFFAGYMVTPVQCRLVHVRRLRWVAPRTEHVHIHVHIAGKLVYSQHFTGLMPAGNYAVKGGQDMLSDWYF